MKKGIFAYKTNSQKSETELSVYGEITEDWTSTSLIKLFNVYFVITIQDSSHNIIRVRKCCIL